MKTRLILVISVVCIFMATLIWKLESFVFSDRLSWAEAQMRTQVSSIQQALAVEINSYQRIVFGLPSINKDRMPWASFKPFFAYGILQKTNSSIETAQWLVQEKSPAGNWNSKELQASFAPLLKNENARTPVLWAWQDSQKNSFVHLAFPTAQSDRWILLSASANVFRALLEKQKANLSTLILLNSQGNILSHSQTDYVGLDMKDHPIFQEIQNSGNLLGVGTYALPSQSSIFGVYEAVPGTNLYVVSYLALSEVQAGKQALIWQFIFLGGGFVVFLLAGLMGLSLVEEKKEKKSSAPIMAATLPQVENKVSSVESQAPIDQVEVYKKIAASLGHELRGPVSAVLGFCQMILVKVSDGEVKGIVDSILREVRSVREIVEKLLAFSGEKPPEKQMMSLQDPIEVALKKMENIFQHKNVNVKKSISTSSSIPVALPQLSQAIENVLLNSVEAMERLAQKEIHISLAEDEDTLSLTIADNGEGIESPSLNKVFDPFFTTRNYSHHTGLGLAVAAGIVKDHAGDISIQSERGKGTQVQMRFHKQQPVAEAGGNMTAPKSQTPISTMPVMTEVNMSKSPVDMNLDNLLDLPELGDAAEEAEAMKSLDEISLPVEVSEISATEPVVTEASSTGLESLDAFANSIRNETPAPTQEEMVMLGDAPAPTKTIAATVQVDLPRFKFEKKKSILDEYKIEVPKPGKRL